MLWFQTLGSAAGVCAGCNSAAGRGGHCHPKAHPGASGHGNSGLGLFAPGTAGTQPATTGTSLPAAHAVLALHQRNNNTTVSSSGYDSFYSRHSPHRRCYMLRSLPQDHDKDRSHKAISPPKECNANECIVAIKRRPSHSHSHSSHSSSSSSQARLHQRSICGEGKHISNSESQRFI